MKSILVIEDEYDLQKALEIRLSGEGFKVYSAGNAEDGLELAREVMPDLITMDIVLLGIMDGIEATYRVKHDDLLKDIPVIIITAKGSEEAKKRAIEGGADAYFTKPFEYEELIMVIKSLIGNRKKTEEIGNA